MGRLQPATRRDAISSASTGTAEPVRVEVSGLHKSFGAVRAVRDLSFTVEPGSVTGFLGPNGAGKTTTLRMLLGLLDPDGGTATFGGVPYAALPDPVRVVGAVLETAFHPGRSGRNHLRVYC
ncbi:MAG: ATP-binding cassette domain-containing protein, partial [Actinomycetes bacterium]